VVHIARRVRDETDGPMLRTGLQGFHGGAIAMPRRSEERPRSGSPGGPVQAVRAGGMIKRHG
jgi:hypothetical protein